MSSDIKLENIKNIYIDVEATGLDESAEIIQIAIVNGCGDVLIDTLVQCQGEISKASKAVHGISKHDLENAPQWPEVHDQICEILSNAKTVYIYNADFDTRLISQTATRYELEVPEYTFICLMEHVAYYNDDYCIKLKHACEMFGVNKKGLRAHTAIGDCEMTRRLHIAITEHEERANVELAEKWADEKRREKNRASRSRTTDKKLAYVPADIDKYPYFALKRPECAKTLSQIALRDMSKYDFAGTCCDAYGNKGYLFFPKNRESGAFELVHRDEFES